MGEHGIHVAKVHQYYNTGIRCSYICVGRYFNLGGALALRFAQCTRLGGSGGMIFAKLAELAMCRISGEEEVKKN